MVVSLELLGVLLGMQIYFRMVAQYLRSLSVVGPLLGGVSTPICCRPFSFTGMDFCKDSH